MTGAIFVDARWFIHPGGRRPGNVRGGGSGTSVAVAVTVVADYGRELGALGDGPAGAVSSDLERFLGPHLGAVTAHIDDVLAARPRHSRLGSGRIGRLAPSDLLEKSSGYQREETCRPRV